jgi:hypothetical protein
VHVHLATYIYAFYVPTPKVGRAICLDNFHSPPIYTKYTAIYIYVAWHACRHLPAAAWAAEVSIDLRTNVHYNNSLVSTTPHFAVKPDDLGHGYVCWHVHAIR